MLFFRILLIVLVCAGSGISCEDESVCPYNTEYYEDRVDTARLAATEEGLVLFATATCGVQWYSVQAVGTVGSQAGRVVWIEGEEFMCPFSSEYMQAVVPWRDGFRVLTEHHSMYIRPGKPIAEAIRFTPGSSVIPESDRLHVTLVMPDGDTVYVVWSVTVSKETEWDWVVGLGVLDDEDRVTPVGEPFYQGPGSLQVYLRGARVFGGLDPETHHFWIFHQDTKRVFELDTDGSVLREAEFDTSNKGYLTNWTKLPSGQWAGMHGCFLCIFTAPEATDMECHYALADAIGVTLAHDMKLDRDGNLWVSIATKLGIYLGRWDYQASCFESETDMPLLVGGCGFVMD
jgi:hypothetical protein